MRQGLHLYFANLKECWSGKTLLFCLSNYSALFLCGAIAQSYLWAPTEIFCGFRCNAAVERVAHFLLAANGKFTGYYF